MNVMGLVFSCQHICIAYLCVHIRIPIPIHIHFAIRNITQSLFALMLNDMNVQ